MKRLFAALAFCFLTLPLFAQDAPTWLSTLPQAKDYALPTHMWSLTADLSTRSFSLTTHARS